MPISQPKRKLINASGEMGNSMKSLQNLEPTFITIFTDSNHVHHHTKLYPNTTTSKPGATTTSKPGASKTWSIDQNLEHLQQNLEHQKPEASNPGATTTSKSEASKPEAYNYIKTWSIKTWSITLILTVALTTYTYSSTNQSSIISLNQELLTNPS